MKFAVMLGERLEAQPGRHAECPHCGAAVIAKCGDYREWHWAHRGERNCDTWWERETEWHRNWKNRFPVTCQEIIRWAPDGEKHIADVLTEHGVVLEFQHSFLRREERVARETFYQNMAWIVDGVRRVRDKPRFFELFGEGKVVNGNPLTIAILADKSAIIRDWADSKAPVFFDFGDVNDPHDPIAFGEPILWFVDPRSPSGYAVVTPITKASFCEFYLTGSPFKGFDYSFLLNRLAGQSATPPTPRPPSRDIGFREHLVRQHFARSRRRF